MASRKYDLAVAYRIYPGVSKCPVVFQDNKYALAELCLRSFRDCLGKLKVKMWVLLDGCPNEYQGLFKQYFDPDDLELVVLGKIGNAETFRKQIEILLSQNVSEAIYFAEDDYYYLSDHLNQMLGFLHTQNAHFITPFDHPDYYRLNLHNHGNFIEVCEGRHWRTASSTCLTFLTTRSTLHKTRDVFLSYTRGNYDSSLWLSLTKQLLLNPTRVVKDSVNDKRLFKIFVKAWIFGWRQIVFGKKWRLWAPIPSIATTLESTCLAPTYDWERILTVGGEKNNLH